MLQCSADLKVWGGGGEIRGSAGGLCGAAMLGGCSDFFEVETKNVLDDENYITEENEVYSGYIGLMTKMQAIGDKVIYLNELRGEMVKPTAFATS